MASLLKRQWLAAVGVAMILAGILTAALSGSDNEVPNDPNIGGGVLVVLGIAALIGAAVVAWSRRGRST